MKIEMVGGVEIGWVPDPDKPGWVRTANIKEYVAEINRLTRERDEFIAALRSYWSTGVWPDVLLRHLDRIVVNT